MRREEQDYTLRAMQSWQRRYAGTVDVWVETAAELHTENYDISVTVFGAAIAEKFGCSNRTVTFFASDSQEEAVANAGEVARLILGEIAHKGNK